MNIITVEGSEYLKEKFLLERGINLDFLAIIKNSDCYIAGGAITSIFSGSVINDYDIYFNTENAYKEFLLKIPSEYKLEWSTDNAKSYKIGKETFQLISKASFMGEPKDILSLFDFTICMGAFSFKETKFYLCDKFLKDLSCKELIVNIKGFYPLATLFRIRKFLHRGYKISGCNIIKLGLLINKLNISNYKELREQLLGIDTAFLKGLTDELMFNMGEKKYDFDEFLKMLDIHITKHYSAIFEE